jgi:hypothetical protein
VEEKEAWSFLYDFIDDIPSNGLDNWLEWVDNRSQSTPITVIHVATALSTGSFLWPTGGMVDALASSPSVLRA